MWEDSNEDDFDNEDDNRFGGYFDRVRESEKEILKIDMNRSLQMPPSLEEWKQFFGEPTEEDCADITQAYLKQYHHHGDDSISMLIDAFDINWVKYLLQYNEMVEEYELCSIIKSHLDIYKKEYI